MTRRPLVHGPIFETIPPPSPFRVGQQRLYAVIGPETGRLNVGQQRLYMINDQSSVTDFRYWRLFARDTNEFIAHSFGEIEFRATVSGADATGSGTAMNWQGFSTPANAFDNDGTTAAVSGIDPAYYAIGYDFGAGNEIAIAEVAITADDDNTYRPFEDFEIQASIDNVVWETKKIVTGEPAWSLSETRTFTI